MTSAKHIVFIPGLLNTSHMWDDLIQEIKPNLPQGISYHSALTTGTHTIQGLAHNITSSLAQEDSILVGFSMGGYISLEIMRSSFAPHVKGLVLIDTSARSEKEGSLPGRSFIISSLEKGQASFKGLGDLAIKKVIHPKNHERKDLIKHIRDMSKAFSSQEYLDQLKAIYDRDDQREYLPQINIPTLILCGNEDTITPPHLSKEMADLIPHSTYKEITQCGHHSPLEQTKQVADHFLSWFAKI